MISTRITNLYGSLPSSVVFAFKTATFGPEIQVSTGPRHHRSLFACNRVWLEPELLLSMGPSPHLWFLHAKQPRLAQIFMSLWVPEITFRFLHAIQRALYQNYYSLCVPVHVCGFCMQNRDFCTEFQICIGPRSHLRLCACNTAWLVQELLVSMGPRHHLSFCAYKTEWLASEILVSMGHSPLLRFLHTKQSLWTPITCLYRSQTSPVVSWMQNSVISTRITRLY